MRTRRNEAFIPSISPLMYPVETLRTHLVYNTLQGRQQCGVEVSQEVHDAAAAPQRGRGSDRG